MSKIKRIEEYIKEHPKAKPKQIAQDLGLTPKQVYAGKYYIERRNEKVRLENKKRYLKKAREVLAAKRRNESTTVTHSATFVPVIKYDEIVAVKPPLPQPIMKAKPEGWAGVWQAIKRAIKGE